MNRWINRRIRAREAHGGAKEKLESQKSVETIKDKEPVILQIFRTANGSKARFYTGILLALKCIKAKQARALFVRNVSQISQKK